ncbi:MAG: SGNH/GDSL hydrolase family protein [Micromonosporaceae bacterium]
MLVALVAATGLTGTVPATAGATVSGAAASGVAAGRGAEGLDASARGVEGRAGAALTFRKYVALGDSYTAGPLIPFFTFDPLGCFKSTRNYPRYLRDRIEVAEFTDASCSGADTSHMTVSQSIPLGTHGPQFDKLPADADLVTVGIGGNDFGTFGKLVGTCPTLRATDPTGTPCRDHFTVDGVDTVKSALPEIGRRVAGVLEGVRAKAPRATIVVVGYPRLVPPSGTCPDVVPFADGDYRWADSVERGLNRQLRRAALLTDATYVDTYTPSRGHDACAGDEAWVNGQHTDIFAAASYHPFASYMAAAASLIQDILAGVTPNPARAAAAARSADGQVSTYGERELSEDEQRALAEAGLSHGGTSAGTLCPTG